MKFSIIVPTFNSAKYLSSTLESISMQNYENIEVLLADGGSKDETLEIASGYKFVRVVSRKDNGQTDGINKAYQFVTGDIVAWQNSDDLYKDGALHKVAEIFRNTESDVVYGDYVLINEKGGEIRKCKSHQWRSDRFRTGRFVPLQPTAFWRKRVSDKVFPLDADLNYCMDVDFFAKADIAGFKFHYTDDFLGSFRIHETGKTSQYKDMLRVLSEHGRVLKRHYRLRIGEHFRLQKNLGRIFLAKLYLNAKG